MSGLCGEFEKICFLVVSFVFGIDFPMQKVLTVCSRKN